MSDKKLVLGLRNPRMNIEHRNALGWHAVVLRHIERLVAAGKIPAKSVPGGVDKSGKVKWKIYPDRVEYFFIPTRDDVYKLWQQTIYLDKSEKVLRCPSMDGIGIGGIRAKNKVFVSGFHHKSFKGKLIPYTQVDNQTYSESYLEVSTCCLGDMDKPPFKDIFPGAKQMLDGSSVPVGSLFYAACDKTTWTHKEPDYLAFFQPSAFVSPFFFTLGGNSNYNLRVVFNVVDLEKFAEAMRNFSLSAPQDHMVDIMRSKEFATVSNIDEVGLRILYNQQLDKSLLRAKGICDAVDSIEVRVLRKESFKGSAPHCLSRRYQVLLEDLADDYVYQTYQRICEFFPLTRQVDVKRRTEEVKKSLSKAGKTLRGKHGEEIDVSFVAVDRERIRGLFISNLVNGRDLWEGFDTFSLEEIGVTGKKCYCRKGIRAMRDLIATSDRTSDGHKALLDAIGMVIRARTKKAFDEQASRGGSPDSQRARVFEEINKMKASWLRKAKANPTPEGIQTLVFCEILEKYLHRVSVEDQAAIYRLIESDSKPMRALLTIAIAGYGGKKRDGQESEVEEVVTEEVEEDASEYDEVC